ncbi:DsbA family protein [Nocardia sp. NBC_01503]|uniref:DsbA family protein n=1 Tax=Nocardia sp. NBC_01503 TaxID=2975997 RepID=UPI002E7B361B|nr:thioredoxin domain-containing protein [Nocardia sp. NBC_01503]WTL35280.1 DsbA family protein [Nocardia sp. NBC_01503]
MSEISKNSTNSNRKLFAGLAVFAAVCLLAIAAFQMIDGNDEPETKAAAAETNPMFAELAKLARREANDPLALGKIDAPVVMIEYSDFQCSFCRTFGRTIEPKLISKYVEQGVLRIEWRNFPIFGQESENAARAAWAAAQQGRFWEFHHIVQTGAPEQKNTGALTPDLLAEFAAQAGVPNMAKFRADQESPASAAAVQRDAREAYALGASSTPTFLINGRPVLGAQPIEQFSAVIDAASNAAKNSPEHAE